MGLAFFGLTSKIAPQFRANVFKEIHEIVFHGQGGYDWSTVYNMPLWLRKFTYSKIKDHYDKQSEMMKKSKESSNPNTTNMVNSDGTVKIPTKSSYK